jgi:hypothetical protein
VSDNIDGPVVGVNTVQLRLVGASKAQAVGAEVKYKQK